MTLLERGDRSLRFQIKAPELANPLLLRQMVEHGLDVVSFQEVPRSLEQAYLQAVTHATQEATHVG